MARATVLKCDTCGTWDSENTPVRNVMVAGPRYDLCTECRTHLMIKCGTDPALAFKYQAMVDERIGVRGNMPALSAAVDWRPGTETIPEFQPQGGERTEEPPVDNADKASGPSFTVVSSNPTSVDVITTEAQNGATEAVPQKGTRRK